LIFAYQVSDPSHYGVVEFDDDGKVISIEEKPLKPKSTYAVPGIYFYDAKAPALARELKPSDRGELEITALNNAYLERGELRVEVLSRATTWLDTGTHESLYEAGGLIERCSTEPACVLATSSRLAATRAGLSTSELGGLFQGSRDNCLLVTQMSSNDQEYGTATARSDTI